MIRDGKEFTKLEGRIGMEYSLRQGYPEPVELASVREALAAEPAFRDVVVQHFGTTRDVLVRLAPQEGRTNAQVSERVLQVLRRAEPRVELRRVEFVGPQVGRELAEKGALALLFALIGILVYVTLRFEWRFAVGSVAALVHDVLITLGFFSLLAIEFDLSVLAALLAVIGYSLNDTIVVYDRIRENFRRLRKGSPVEVMNFSINQTLSRTLMTSLTTLLVLITLFLLGGEIIHGFALALILGGALGNVIDRVVYGHVVDFLDFHLNGYHWPAFDVADCGICIGAVLLIIDELRRVRR